MMRPLLAARPRHPSPSIALLAGHLAMATSALSAPLMVVHRIIGPAIPVGLLPITLVAVGVPIGYGVGPLRHHSRLRRAVAIAGALLASGYTLWESRYRAWPLLSLAWIERARHDSDSLSGALLLGATVLTALLLWNVGVWIGAREPSGPDSAQFFVVGLITLLAGLLTAAVVRYSATSDLELTIFVFCLCGLLTLPLSQREWELARRHGTQAGGRPPTASWALLAAGSGTVIAAMAGLVAVGTQSIPLSSVFERLGAAIHRLLQLIHRDSPVVWSNGGRIEVPAPLSGQSPPPPPPSSFGFVLFALVVGVAAILLSGKLLRQGHAAHGGVPYEEERTAVERQKGVRSRGARPVRSRHAMQSWPDGEEARTVREAYRGLLRLGARSRLARSPRETPLEYAGRLNERFPSATQDLSLLTTSYMRDRYGDEHLRPSEISEAIEAWRRVKDRAGDQHQ